MQSVGCRLQKVVRIYCARAISDIKEETNGANKESERQNTTVGGLWKK